MTVSEMVAELFKDECLTDKKRRILEAAIEIISVKGYNATSSREIAKMAGVAEGTIFKYFQTKSELLIIIINKTLSLIKQNVQYYLWEYEYDNLAEFISTLIEKSYFFVKRYLPVMKIFIQEVIFQRTIHKTKSMDLWLQINEKLTGIILKFKYAGELKEIEPNTAQRIILISIIGLLTNSFLLPDKITDEQEIQTTTHYLINGLKRQSACL